MLFGADAASESLMGSEDGQWREKEEEDMSSGKSLRAKAWRPGAPSELDEQGENSDSIATIYIRQE